MIKKIKRWLKRKNYTSKMLTRKETKQMLKIFEKYSSDLGLDWDGDLASVYVDISANQVEII